MIAEKTARLPSEVAEVITWDEFLLLGEFYAFRNEEERKALEKSKGKTPPARRSRR